MHRVEGSDRWVNHIKRVFKAHWPVILVVVLCLGLELGGNPVRQALAYDRPAVLAGQWWRLITANFVHSGWPHVLLDLAGLVLLWLLFGQTLGPLRFWIATLVGCVAVGLGVFFLSPDVEWYVGISGVLHTYWASGALLAVARREWGGRWLLGFLIAKLVYERIWGPLPTSTWSIGGPILTIAHLYGAIAGALLGFLWIAFDRRHAEHPTVSRNGQPAA
ncbi:MAG: rhombosortase [Gammaproteobacteria bacterium]